MFSFIKQLIPYYKNYGTRRYVSHINFDNQFIEMINFKATREFVNNYDGLVKTIKESVDNFNHL